MATPDAVGTPLAVRAYHRTARHARAFGALAVTAIPILWERRELEQAADDCASFILVATTGQWGAQTLREDTDDDEITRLVDEADDAMAAAARCQSELRAAIRAQQHADRGGLPL